MKRAIIIFAVSLLVGCNSAAPDMGPIGAGLSTIGLGIVIASVIRCVAGALSRHEEEDERGGRHDA